MQIRYIVVVVVLVSRNLIVAKKAGNPVKFYTSESYKVSEMPNAMEFFT